MRTNDRAVQTLKQLHRELYDLEVFLKEQAELAKRVGRTADAGAFQKALKLASAAHMLSHELGASDDDDEKGSFQT